MFFFLACLNELNEYWMFEKKKNETVLSYKIFINQITFLPPESFFLLGFMFLTVCVCVQECVVCKRVNVFVWVWVFLCESVYMCVCVWIRVTVWVRIYTCMCVYGTDRKLWRFSQQGPCNPSMLLFLCL